MVCSCTITKRHFGNGYHVEWNRKIRTASDESSKLEMYTAPESTNESDSLIKGQTESAENSKPLVLSEVDETQDEIKTDEIQAQTSGQILHPERTIRSKEIQPVQKPLKADTMEPEDEEVPKKRMHPLMWGIWGMWSIAIACMFFVTVYAEFLIGVGIGFFIAMIFAIIVLHGLRKHREKYRFKGLSYPFAILAIVFGGITILGLVIFLLGGVPLGPGA